ncbi:hypothetical protein A2U01_0056675 [Trifolium medium]|uniref:Uncharacterized protein n=1 Tax=Trifolium medium TaxID=97028 RepID=A0A392RHD4_9FABA|nr:hypothetical protein [Trifolium medium]
MSPQTAPLICLDQKSDRVRRYSDGAPVEAKGGCVPADTPTLKSA